MLKEKYQASRKNKNEQVEIGIDIESMVIFHLWFMSDVLQVIVLKAITAFTKNTISHITN